MIFHDALLDVVEQATERGLDILAQNPFFEYYAQELCGAVKGDREARQLIFRFPGRSRRKQCALDDVLCSADRALVAVVVIGQFFEINAHCCYPVDRGAGATC